MLFCFDMVNKKNDDHDEHPVHKTDANESHNNLLESPMQLPFMISSQWREKMKLLEKRPSRKGFMAFLSSTSDSDFDDFESPKKKNEAQVTEMDHVLETVTPIAPEHEHSL
jgi:hypothetical protein